MTLSRTPRVDFIAGAIAAPITIRLMGAFSHFTVLFFVVGAAIGVGLFLSSRPLGLGFLCGTVCTLLFFYWLFSQMAWPEGF